MSFRIRVGAICHENGRILLVEHEKEQERYWLLPGGGMNPGETAVDALTREVLEETSVGIEAGRLVCVCESISPDRTRHIVHFLYEARRLSGSPGKSSDPRVRRSELVAVDSLDRLKMYPPIQAWLKTHLSEGFADPPQCLGAMWADP